MTSFLSSVLFGAAFAAGNLLLPMTVPTLPKGSMGPASLVLATMQLCRGGER